MLAFLYGVDKTLGKLAIFKKFYSNFLWKFIIFWHKSLLLC